MLRLKKASSQSTRPNRGSADQGCNSRASVRDRIPGASPRTKRLSTISRNVKVPIVVRLTGTNEQEAVKILQGIGMTALSDMDEAVSQVVARAREAA